MLKTFLALGLILVAIGSVVMLNYNSTTTTKGLELPEVASDVDTWSISSAFKKGDWIVVVYRQSAFWLPGDPALQWELADDVYPYPHFFVSISIADPYKNETIFVEAVTYQEASGRLVPYPPEVTKNGSLVPTLAVDPGGVQGVGGIVQYDGLYNVTMTAEFRQKYPPSWLGIYRYITKEQRNIIFLPVGAVILGTGMTSLFFGVRSRKRKIPVKGKRE